MSVNAENQQPEPDFPLPEEPFPRYWAVMAHARELTDNAAAKGATLDFDTAFGHARVFDEAVHMPVSPLIGEKSLRDLKSADVFRLAEGLDAVMAYGSGEQRFQSAAIAADLHHSLLYEPAQPAGQKQLIMDRILGINGASPQTVAEQIADRYFDGTVEEHSAAVEGIAKFGRSVTPVRQ